MVSEYNLQFPTALKSVTVTEETKKSMPTWIDVLHKLRIYPAGTASPKHVAKLSILFRKASSMEVKISTNGKSPTSLYKGALH